MAKARNLPLDCSLVSVRAMRWAVGFIWPSSEPATQLPANGNFKFFDPAGYAPRICSAGWQVIQFKLFNLSWYFVPARSVGRPHILMAALSLPWIRTVYLDPSRLAMINSDLQRCRSGLPPGKGQWFLIGFLDAGALAVRSRPMMCHMPLTILGFYKSVALFAWANCPVTRKCNVQLIWRDVGLNWWI